MKTKRKTSNGRQWTKTVEDWGGSGKPTTVKVQAVGPSLTLLFADSAAHWGRLTGSNGRHSAPTPIASIIVHAGTWGQLERAINRSGIGTGEWVGTDCENGDLTCWAWCYCQARDGYGWFSWEQVNPRWPDNFDNPKEQIRLVD